MVMGEEDDTDCTIGDRFSGSLVFASQGFLQTTMRCDGHGIEGKNQKNKFSEG